MSESTSVNPEVIAEWVGSVSVTGSGRAASVYAPSEAGCAELVESVAGDYDPPWEIQDLEVKAYDHAAKRALVEKSLIECAVVEQRTSAAEVHRLYRRGRPMVQPRYGDKELVQQRFSQIPSLMQLASVDDAQLYEAFEGKKVVITRVSAPTGSGKTRRMPAKIAQRFGLRVLQVEPDVNIVEDAMTAQVEEFGIKASYTRWSRQKGAYLTVMSYHDYWGCMASGSRERLIADFDVHYFDEGHMPLWFTHVAVQCFTNYTDGETSLVVVSATVSQNAEDNVTSNRVGAVSVLDGSPGLNGFLASDDDVYRNIRDRTLVLVASLADVYAVADYYRRLGLDVEQLTPGVRRDKIKQVNEWLKKPAVTPRIVVGPEFLGTSYNLRTSYVVTSATRMVYLPRDDASLEEREVPVREAERAQHVGRTGRGLAPGSGALLLSGALDETRTPILRSEAGNAYVGLVAAGIQPRGYEAIEKFFPSGLTAPVAWQLRQLNFESLLATRYLAADGLFPERFIKGLELFACVDARFIPSKYADPVGYDLWVEDTVGNYYEGDKSRSDVRLLVPFVPPPSLKVKMHTISAVAAGWLEVPRYYPDMYESESSDVEMGPQVGTRRKVVAKPRLMVEVPKEEKPLPASPEAWRYDAAVAEQYRPRKPASLGWRTTVAGKESIRQLMRSVKDDSVGEEGAAVTPGVSGVGVEATVMVGSRSPVVVESPGGTVVLQFKRDLYELVVRGGGLQPGQFVELLVAIKAVGARRFVTSALFDNWSGAWLTLFKSAGDVDASQYVVSAGHGPLLSRVVVGLYDRFRDEALSVVQSSNLYKSKVTRLFRGSPSLSKLASAVKRGEVPIAQTDRFIGRLLNIKDLHDVAILSLEEVGLFMPSAVTAAQKKLPIRDRHRRMRTIDESVVPPSRGSV